jgi:hypothetical protein
MLDERAIARMTTAAPQRHFPTFPEIFEPPARGPHNRAFVRQGECHA